jgi:hypothetical protein
MTPPSGFSKIQLFEKPQQPSPAASPAVSSSPNTRLATLSHQGLESPSSPYAMLPRCLTS